MSDIHHAPDTEEAPSPNLFRRGATWLRKTGIGAAGKKAKRLIHRRNRQAAKHQLRNLTII